MKPAPAILLAVTLLAGASTASFAEPPDPAPDPAAPAPLLDCRRAFAQPMLLWPPDRVMVPIEIHLPATDAERRPRIEVLSVRQNTTPMAAGEEGGKNPNTRFCPDATVSREGRLELRAERIGGGTGRIYVVEFRATTAAGPSCTGTVTVRVPQEKGKPDENPARPEDATYDSRRCD